ncbi:MAG: hypothetical protein PHV42_04100 [Candidatus Pacebacteria bacterium]|nr:hypothetical protein [Candidatus Paceibacterota bacterium]
MTGGDHDVALAEQVYTLEEARRVPRSSKKDTRVLSVPPHELKRLQQSGELGVTSPPGSNDFEMEEEETE